MAGLGDKLPSTCHTMAELGDRLPRTCHTIAELGDRLPSTCHTMAGLGDGLSSTCHHHLPCTCMAQLGICHHHTALVFTFHQSQARMVGVVSATYNVSEKGLLMSSET